MFDVGLHSTTLILATQKVITATAYIDIVYHSSLATETTFYLSDVHVLVAYMQVYV